MKTLHKIVKAANILKDGNLGFNKQNFVNQQLNDYLSFWIDGYIPTI